jgi:NADP-dependent 3-hydroxy acid dehydrogenase YdfG
MSGRLAGKIAVVTAAGQGIGRATAIAFADEGAAVWATDINEALLAALSASWPEIRTRRLDVCESEDVADFAAEVGSIDVLFNCAGYVHHGSILDCEENDWDFSFDLNVKSMYRTCRAFLPAMQRTGKGNIKTEAASRGRLADLLIHNDRRSALLFNFDVQSLLHQVTSGDCSRRFRVEICDLISCGWIKSSQT